jgi:hypothetical protein
MKKPTKRKMTITLETIRDLNTLTSVSGARPIEPVSTKPCSDGTCYIWHTVCQ